MNSETQHYHTYEASTQATPGAAAMMLILQILPQLQFQIKEQHQRFQEMEQHYGLKMSSLYNENRNLRNTLTGTVEELNKIQDDTKMLYQNFSKEKEHFMTLLNDKNKSLLNYTNVIMFVSKELTLLTLNDTTDGINTTKEKLNISEHEIKKSLTILAKFIQKMKKEQNDKEMEMKEIMESYNEEAEEKQRCLESNAELQNELNDAKDLEEQLNEIKEEKEQLKHTNENQLKKMLSLVEIISVQQNKSLETILKQTSAAAIDIHKYIVQPAERAYNLTLAKIVKNHTKIEALQIATQKGNLTEIVLLLDAGANIESEDEEYKFRPLHWAVKHGHCEAARLLLLRGANVNAHAGLHNATPLHIAVDENNDHIMDLLLKGGADIEASDDYKFRPLHWAVKNGHGEATKLLLLRGANVSAPGGLYNATPLHIAVDENNHDVMDLLLKAGADIEARDNVGSTPLIWSGIRDCQTANILVERGANISTSNNGGISVLDRATDCIRELLCSKGATHNICNAEVENSSVTTVLPDS